MLPRAPAHEASAWAQGALGNAILQDALTAGASTSGLGLEQLVASEVTLAAGGIGGQAEEMSSNQAMLRAMRDAMSMDLEGSRAVSTIGTGGGSQLPTEQLTRFEFAFGRDFSHVRIHADGRAAAAADALQAYAFALGAHVYFGRGQYAPGTRSGDRILAHELTHVVQSDQGRLPSGKTGDGVQVSSPSDPHEVEAYTNEVKMLDALQQADRAIASGDLADESSVADMSDAPAVDQAAAAPEADVSSAPSIADAAPDVASSDVGTADSGLSETGGEMSAAPAGDLGFETANAAPADAPAMLDREGETLDTAGASSMIRNSRGGALPAAVQQRMAAVLGHDFAHVRVHTDDAAAKAAEALGARAFALGDDVFFGAGEYSPGTDAGDRVLAHELTHVKQHDEGRLPQGSSDGLDVSSPSDSAEREAEAMADVAAPALAEMPSGGAELAAVADSGAMSEGAMAGGLEGVAHREMEPTDGTSQGGVADEYEFHIGSLVHKVKAPKGAAAGADVVFPLGWQVVNGLTLTEARVHLGADGKIEHGTAKGTFGMEPYVSGGDATLQIGAEGQISAHVHGNYDLGWVKGEFDADIGAEGVTATIPMSLTRPIADSQGRFAIESADGTVTLSSDGKWSAAGTVTGTWTGVGKATIKINAENEHLHGEVDLALEVIHIGENVEVGPTHIHGTYDSVDGITLEGEIHARVGDFEADLHGKLELDAEGGLIGADGGTGPSASPSAGAPAAGAPAADAGAGAPGAGGGRSRPGAAAPAAGGPAAGGPAAGGPAHGGPASGGPASGGPASGGPASSGPAAGGPASGDAAAGGAGGAPGAGGGAASGGRKKRRGQAAAPQGAQGGQAAGPTATHVPAVPKTSIFPGGGTLNLPQGATIGGRGVLKQTKAIEVDGFTITGGEISIGLEENTFTQVGTAFDYSFDKYAGHIDAIVDVATGEVNGKGTCHLTEDVAIGDTGATIKSATGAIEIVDSKPKTLTGTFEIEAPFENQPTFKVVGSDLSYDFDKGEVGGTVTATTLRELTIGEPAQLHAVIATGATASAEVGANKLTKIDGGLDYTVLDKGGEIGAGKISMTFTEADSLNAEADFHLTAEYGLPERANGPLWLKEGSTFKVTVVEGALDKASLEQVTFEFANPTGEGGVKGDLHGDYTFSTGLVEGTGHAEVAIPWTIRGETWGHITFTEGGALDVEIKDSNLDKLGGNFPYTASINAGDKVLELEGELKGDYDKESDTFGGELNGTLKNALEFPLEGGAQLKVLPEATAKITVTKSDFDAVEVTFDCEYTKAGESDAFLGGHIEKATYDLKTGFIRFDGTVKLMQDIEKESADAKWKLRALKDSTVTVEVRDSALTKIGGDIKFEIDDEEGKFLEGDLKGLELDVTTFEFTGDVDVKTARDFNFPHKKDEGDVAAYRLNVKKDSHAYGRVEKNDLANVGAELDFSVDFLQVTEAIEGNVKGDWNFKTDEFNGGATAEVKKPFPLAGGQKKDAGGKELESFIIGVLPTSAVDINVQANKLQRAHVDLIVGMEYNNQDVATGNLSGDYKIGDEENGFTGDAVVDITKRFEWAEGSGEYSYQIEQGTRAAGSMQNNVMKSASGVFILIGHSKTRSQDEWKLDAAGDWSPDTGVTGDGGIHILKDIVVGHGDTYTAVICQGSEATGKVEADEFKELHGTVHVRMDEGTKPKLAADFEITYTAGADSKITATGEATTLDDFDIGGLGDFTFVLATGSKASASVKDNELEYIDGDVTINVKRSSADFGVAHVNGKYTHGKTPNFTGKGTFDVTAPETDLGINLPGGMTVFLVAGAGMQAQITDNNLDTLSAGVPLLVKKDGAAFIDVKLDGTYFAKTKKFTGTALGKLIPRVQVGQEVNGYKFFVDPSTGVTAEFSDAGIQSLGGTLKTSLEDTEGLFLTAEGQALWTFGAGGAEGSLDATGKVTVARKKLLAGQGAEWSVSIAKGSNGEVDIKKSDLVAIRGSITINVDKDSKPFADVGFSEGGWTKETGFNGKGTAKLLVDRYEMATFAGYTFTLLNGSGGNVIVGNSKVTDIDGTIKIGIDKGTTGFMAGELTGDYNFEKKEFNGGGSIAVVNPQLLASVGSDEQLWLIEGSGVDVHIAKNDLDKVGGQLTLSLRDGGGEYLTCALKGSYDIKGGTGFTGDGAVDIKRRKQLFALDAYKFLLDKGAGAKAWIVKNDITAVKGNIPFVVQDATGDLLVGQAEGDYDAKTGKFNGKGDVHLGRDIDFPVGGSGLVIKFKKGSGGRGEVVDSKLTKLGGTLEAELWKDGKGVVSVKADGEYDAVANEIVTLNGKATLLQPISLLDGNVIISDVAGTATIEHNKLVAASGEGKISLPKLGEGNAVSGKFKLTWSNQTGKDVYEGSGEIEFGLFNDPAKGRAMTGKVAATYRSDDTFDVDGNVHYQMNEMIGGDVHVKMDQTFDPVIDAQMAVNGTLVPGRDLFRMEQDIIPRTTTPIYGPIALIYGVKGGLGLSMQALTFSTIIGISNWKPKEGNVPNFHADLAMNWGMDFDAMLAAYMSLSLSVGVADIGAGIRGTLALDAPLNITPYAALDGGPNGFAGELGVGISLAPTMSLKITPYVEAAIIGLDPFQHDFDGIDIDFGELFKFEWGTSYKFGDQNAREAKAPQAQPVAAPHADTTTKVTEPPAFGGGGGGGGGSAVKGAPQVESGSEIGGKQGFAGAAGKGGGQMGELMAYIDKIKVISQGLGAMGYLMGLLSGCLTALSFGPIGLGLYLIYLYIFEDFSFEKVGKAIDDVLAAVKTAYEILEPYLPDWLNDLIKVIKNPPSLYDMLFGADDAARDSVRSGEIFQAKGESRPKLHGEAVYNMLDGWTGEDDQECILILLQRGDLGGILNRVSTDWILDDLDGYEDDQARKVFRERGIAF